MRFIEWSTISVSFSKLEISQFKVSVRVTSQFGPKLKLGPILKKGSKFQIISKTAKIPKFKNYRKLSMVQDNKIHHFSDYIVCFIFSENNCLECFGQFSHSNLVLDKNLSFYEKVLIKERSINLSKCEINQTYTSNAKKTFFTYLWYL